MNYDPTPEELEALKRQHGGLYVYAPTPEALAEYRAWALQRLRERAAALDELVRIAQETGEYE